MKNILLEKIASYDNTLHDYIQSKVDLAGNFHDFLMFITHLGNPIPSLAIAIIIILFLILKKKYREIKIFSIAAIVAVLIIGVLKEIFMRGRPEGIIDVPSYSFPSGHALIVAVIIPLFVYFSLPYFKSKIFKNLFIIISYSYIFIMSWTRLYLGVHYLSDIVVGILIGGVISVATILIIKKKPLR